MQDEESLVRRAQQRDEEAFATLYEEYFDKIYRYVTLRIGDQAEAEDMTQQVFVKVLQSISSFKWKGIPFSAWLFRQVVGNESQRCRYCFRLRLSKTAETAHQMGFDAFTTTLLISPHQKHDLLQEIGDELAEEKGIDFLYIDLRKRYSDSRRMTKPLNLHRQQYCGCIYSEWERYANITIE